MKKTLLITLPVIIAGISQLSAQTSIASFGGDYVTVNQNSQASLVDLSGVPTASDSIRERGGFGVTNNPTINADYTGPAFNGGAQVVKFGSTAANGLSDAAVFNDAGGDYVDLFAQSPSGTNNSHLNFIFSMDVNTSYGDLTSFSGRTAGGVSAAVTSRFMIRDTGGTLYLSTTNISGGFGGSTWEIADLSTESWAIFTPGAENWRGDFGSLTFDQTISGSTAIDQVGWFASRDSGAGGFTNSRLTIREFNVQAIPEPSAYAMLAGLLTLGAVMLRRRRA